MDDLLVIYMHVRDRRKSTASGVPRGLPDLGPRLTHCHSHGDRGQCHGGAALFPISNLRQCMNDGIIEPRSVN